MINIEFWLRATGLTLGLCAIVIELFSAGRTARTPARYPSKSVQSLLAPLSTFTLAILWLAACYLLWRPIPLDSSPIRSVVFKGFGAFLYFCGLGLYLWGLATMGKWFAISSSLGTKLYESHKLITLGPFAFVRHPMYLGLIIASIGGIMLYRTWTFVFIATCFLSLFFRAQKEEIALEKEFGDEWQEYKRRVPAWIPRSKSLR